MNFDFVAHRLQQEGWKNIGPHDHAGLKFELTASGKDAGHAWLLFVKAIPILDETGITDLQRHFDRLAIKLPDKSFSLFIITQKATLQALQFLKNDERVFRKPNRRKGIIYKIFVVDEKGNTINGPYPAAAKDEAQVPPALVETFHAALTPDGAAYPNPSIQGQVDTALELLRPTTALKLLEGNQQPELEVDRVEALRELGCMKEAARLLEEIIPKLHGDPLARARRFMAQALYDRGAIDAGILLAEEAARNVQDTNLKGAIIAIKANGLALKRCLGLAESAMREAYQVAPEEPRILFSQARFYLDMDRRLEARAIYERLSESGQAWVRGYADWGRAHVAYLLGEFDQARDLAVSLLQYFNESINPYYVLFQVASAKNDLKELEKLVAELEKRDPRPDVLEIFKAEYKRLQARFSGNSQAPQHRLESFPTLVQRRNYCGPCTIELVLRYWKGGLDLSNDQIAARVKLPESGTPTHHMTEFFRLVGFDTVRCFAPVDKLKQLVDAGFPVIVEEEAAGNAHVTVVIGYDDAANTVELQDPMTHTVIPMPVDMLNRFRRTHFNSAIIAFPARQGHDQKLARLGLFNSEVLALSDQASLASGEERFDLVRSLMENATQKEPQHGLSWILWLNAELMLWQAARYAASSQPGELAAKLNTRPAMDPQAAKERFYAVLAGAKEIHPQAEFIFQFEGQGALVEGALPQALASFEKAREVAPEDARLYSAIAECQYSLRSMENAWKAAEEAVKRDPGSPAGNVWMARCLVHLGKEHADHYARAAVDLAPGWWMPHQAMAEAYMQQNNFPAAWHEAETVLAMRPGQPDARLLKAILLSIRNDDVAAATELESIFKESARLTPIAIYKARQTLCRLFFKQRLFDIAIEQIGLLLAIMPDDPWALQFLPAARFEALLANKKDGQPCEAAVVADIQSQYEKAIEANRAETWIVRDYLTYLSRATDQETAMQAAGRLRGGYPDKGNLAFIHGDLLMRAGKQKEGAQAMQEALEKLGGIQDGDQLYNAAHAMLLGMGLLEGEVAFMGAKVPENGASMQARLRALALVLALYPQEKGARARELLRTIVANEPNDALAILRLGMVAETEAEREKQYRQALIVAPRWPQARSNLANYLSDRGRGSEALEFTTGHENEAPDNLVAHAYALERTSRHEEAAAFFEKAAQEINPPVQPTPWLYYQKWLSEIGCSLDAKALATLERAMLLFPQELAWYSNKVTTLCKMGRLEEAAAVIEAGKTAGLKEVDVLRSRHEIARTRQDHAEALNLVERILVITQEKTANGRLGWWMTRKLRLLADLGRTKEAFRYAEAEKLNATGWGNAAWELSNTREDKLVLQFAERALKLDPRSYSGLIAKAWAARNLDQKGSREMFVALRDMLPNEHNAYEELARYTALDGRLDEALTLAERAVALGMYCPYSWGARGCIHFLRGDLMEAVRDLQICWNRATVEQRRVNPLYGWLLAALQGNADLARSMKEMTEREARSTFDRQILLQVESTLARQGKQG